MTEENKPAIEQKEEEFSLEKRIENVIKDVLEVKLKALEASMDKKIEEILKTKEVEMEQALRKGFGLEQDPVIHQSDLVTALRKAALEKTDNTRSPAAAEKAGPEGNKPKDPFDEMMKPWTEVQK
jgi:hypothetical protein